MSESNIFSNGVVLEGSGEISPDDTTKEEIFPLCAGEDEADSTADTSVASAGGFGEGDRDSGSVTSDGIVRASSSEGACDNGANTDPSEESCGAYEEGVDEKQAGSGNYDDPRDALLSADDQQDIHDDSNGEPAEDSGVVHVADSASQPSTTGLVLVKLDDIVIEKSTYSREEVDNRLVDDYLEAFRNGADFPPPALDKATENDEKKTVVDGAHRVTMYKRYRTSYTEILEAYRKEVRDLESDGSLGEAVPLSPPPPPEEILCKFVERPKDIPLVLYGVSVHRDPPLRVEI